VVASAIYGEITARKPTRRRETDETGDFPDESGKRVTNPGG
jgi:hypothetical protein